MININQGLTSFLSQRQNYKQTSMTTKSKVIKIIKTY